MSLTDITGQDIEVGDTVAYTGVAYGRNLPPVQLGEVYELTKASVKVYRINGDQTPIMKDEYVSGQGWVKTDQVKQDTVRWYDDRFVIIKKH